MEDSGKHRFHGREHDSKMRLYKTYSHTSTLRGYEAPEKLQSRKPQAKDGRRETYTEHSSEWRDRQARELSLPQIREGNEAREKGKRKLRRKNRNKNKKRKRWGRRRKSQRPRGQNPERSQKPTRTRYVRNPTHARVMGIVPHPAGATSKPGGELPGKSPQEKRIKNTEQ